MSSILVIEADPIARNLIIHLLVRQGHTVYEAANAREALLLRDSVEPLDLLIVDHDISGGDYSNTKVLRTSKESLDDQSLRPQRSFLKKPFTPAELLDSVKNLLNPRLH